MAISIGTEPLEGRSDEIRRPDDGPSAPANTAINRTLVVLVVAIVIAVGSMLVATFGGLRLLAPARPAHRNPRHRLAGRESCAAGARVGRDRAGDRVVRAAPRDGGGGDGVSCLRDVRARLRRQVLGGGQPISRISPFHYFDPFTMIGGRPLSTRRRRADGDVRRFRRDRQRVLRLARSLIGSSTSSWR